jgi:hypothetical protein
MSITIDQALADTNLLGAGLGDATTWGNWRTLLKAAFALPLSPAETKFFHQVAGDRRLPTRRVSQAWFILGRRSGKSRVAAAIAVFLACFRRHKLSPGETGFVLVLAASRSQARQVFEYAKGFLQASPILRSQIIDSTADEIRLRGNVIISVLPNNYRTVRGRTLIGCVFDEAAFWRSDDSALPDVETYRAVLPALATTKGMLVGISSPYAQHGLIYSRYRDHYGRDGDVLVVRAGSLLLNPTLDRSLIDAAKVSDPEAAAAEWDAEWRGDLAMFVSRETVERCVEHSIAVREPEQRWKYSAFVDPSGGVSDSMTLAIAHRDHDRVVLDALREVRAPFEPDVVVADFARLLKTYRVTTVKGDRYSGEWVPAAFRAQGIAYQASERSKSEIYLDSLPLFTNGTALLLDDMRLVSQLSQLERRASRMGRDTVDHRPGAHDDLANAACGALVHAAVAAPIDIGKLPSKAITSARNRLTQRPDYDRPRPSRGAQS